MKKNYITPTMNVFHVQISTGLLSGSLTVGGDDNGNGISSSKRHHENSFENDDDTFEDEW